MMTALNEKIFSLLVNADDAAMLAAEAELKGDRTMAVALRGASADLIIEAHKLDPEHSCRSWREVP